MKVRPGDQGLGGFDLGADFVLGMERRGIGQAELRESVGGLDDGTLGEVEVEGGAEGEGGGAKGAAGHDEFAAAGLGNGGDGLLEGVGVEGPAIAHGAEVGEGEGAVGDDGERGLDVIRSGDIDGGGADDGGDKGSGDGKGREEREGMRDAFHGAGFHWGGSKAGEIQRDDEPEDGRTHGVLHAGRLGQKALANRRGLRSIVP